MKKKVYFVQVGVSYYSPCFLPYSVGCIVAYIKNDNYIKEHYEIPDIIVRREKIEDVINRFDNPAYVAFSCYTWNIEYNKTLASKLKELYPDVKIIFGGHSVPHDTSFLDKYEFVDYLMHNEGEETTAAFLKAISENTDLAKVPNLSYRTEKGNVTTKFYHPSDISAYPSPYTEGVFDNILKENPGVEFHATLETNRGCPYDCAYCEWCFTKKIRQFPMEKIKSEIEWIAKNKISYCYCADANFGIFERDIEIAEYVVEQKKKYGYPYVFKPNYAKESNEYVFKAGYILNKNQADKGITLAYQSVSEEVLENIGRKNFPLEYFRELDAKYTAEDIPTYTELILGMPGETYKSFSTGLCEILEHGQHNSMLVYECQVYDNAPMGDHEYKKKFGIKTSRIPIFGIHYNPEFSGVQEYFDVITETNSMPKADWVKSFIFCIVLQAFHHFGLLKFFALYLRNEKNVSYFDFYNNLIEYIFSSEGTYINELFVDLYLRKSDTEKADWTYQKNRYGRMGWYFEEGAFLELVYHWDEFWNDILPFLKSFEYDDGVFDDLLNYQKMVIRKKGVTEVVIESNHNFYSYFSAIIRAEKIPLKNIKTKLSIKSDCFTDTWESYAKQTVWFGKRHHMSLYTNLKEKVEYTEE